MAGLGPLDYLRSTELEQVVEEEEDFGEDELIAKIEQGEVGGVEGSQSMIETTGGDPNSERASGYARSVSASSVSSVSSTGSVRTAKAERRLKDRLIQEVGDATCFFDNWLLVGMQ